MGLGLEGMRMNIDTTQTGPAPRENPTRRSLLLLVALAAILLLALALRVYQLGEQSVWYDEYLTAAFVDAPHLWTCLDQQRDWDWHMVPVYHTMMYYWGWLVGGSMYGIRWLSILFGMLAFPVLYWIGRDLYGRWAGIVAMLCMAMSPFHIYHAQGIRPYALVTLLGLVSVYSLLKFADGHGRKWFVLNIVINILLMWTHLFGTLLLIPEGLFLLLFRFRPFLRNFAWGCAHLIGIVPLGLWMMTVRVGTGPVAEAPLLKHMFADMLFNRENIYIRWVLHVIPKDADHTIMSDFVHRLLALRLSFEEALIYAWCTAAGLLFVGTIVACLWPLVRKRFGRADAAPAATAITTRQYIERFVLLILWFIVPSLVLFALARYAHLWVFHERFSIYSSPALYLMAGGALSMVRPVVLRVILTGGLMALLAFQTLLGLEIPTRQGYLPAANVIKSGYAAPDAVVVYGYQAQRLLAFNLRPTTLPIADAMSFEQLLDLTDTALDPQHTVWALLLSVANFPGQSPQMIEVAEKYERYLQLRHIAFDRRVWVGTQNVYLYHCTRGDAYQSLQSPETIAAFESFLERHPEDGLIRLRLAKALQYAERWEEALAQYRKAAEAAPGDNALVEKIGMMLEKLGRVDEALREYRKLAENDPAHATLTLGSALMRMGKPEEAIQEYRKALERFPNEKWLWIHLASAFQTSGRTQDALETYQKAVAQIPDDPTIRLNLGMVLDQLGRVDEAVAQYRAVIERTPSDPLAYTKLGMVLKQQGDLAGAIDPLKTAARMNPNDVPIRAALIETLCQIKDYASAWDQVSACQQAGLNLPDYVLNRLEQESGRTR